ncbi:MAG TPA: hypothetical protein VNA69_05600 [Thermoanaerobaculia bacterium]|nr:hypothetical protein [Thermoanaerobaculia bacterium]
MNWEFVIGVVLGILGFGIGVYHVAGLRNATKRLSTVTEQLADVQGGLSTRYIGDFPYFMGDVVQLLRSATRKIVIFCDFPGYGTFSDPVNALAYEHVLDEKKVGVELSLTCLDQEARHRQVRQQFRAEDWNSLQSDKTFKNKLRRFVAARAVGLNAENLTYDEFIQVMERLDAVLIENIFGQGRTSQIRGHFQLHFWIVDDKTAIFTIPTRAEPVLEYAFKTSDRALIEAFLPLPSLYRRAAALELDVEGRIPVRTDASTGGALVDDAI